MKKLAILAVLVLGLATLGYADVGETDWYC
jgi:hypothetical protein